MKNKVILVTGSTSGIGKAIALLFSSLGSKVVITGRQKTEIAVVAEQCYYNSPFNYKPLQVVADLTVDDDIVNLVNATIHHFKKIDVLVNNAGIGFFTPINDANIMNLYRSITDINLRAPLYLAHLTEPYLQQSKGCIINISSITDSRPLKQLSVYCCSKSALDMLTKSLSIELGPKGIRVNSVNPGVVDTAFLIKFGLSEEVVEKLKKMYADVNPLRRLADPIEIAELVVFLASNDATYINGVNYNIDGGTVYENFPELQ